MCGICGIIHFSDQKVEPTAISAMMRSIKHRGPDDEGVFFHQNIGLGHVRLSIIDLSSNGRQPMDCSDNRYVITYNGEIYNYLELKKELSQHFNFTTNTDTEVLLNAFKLWGKSCLDKLNGMFAFAIYDKQEGSIFMARDRFGIKPVYYYLDENLLIFGSEIKSILTQKKSPTPNQKIVSDFLIYDRVQHSEDTFFKDIKKLQHGHFMTVNNGNTRIERWYHLAEHIQQPFQSPQEYKEQLIDSINLRMRSDVTVGACLSGGLDSSSIVSLMLEQKKDSRLHTFSAIYKSGERGDESEFIQLYRSQVQNMHFIEPSASSLEKDLNNFIVALEEPMPGLSEYAEYKVMELAKTHATVILNGQGADEVLAGYHYFFGFYYKELLSKLKLFTLGKEITHYLKNHKSTLALQALIYFFLPPAVRSKLTSSSKGYINNEFLDQYKDASQLDNLYTSKNLQQSFLNHFEYKFEHHLLWGDKSSMKNSLELRFPFLDHQLIEKTLGVLSHQLIQNGQTKLILREAMKNVLPEKIRLRKDKVGFETPSAKWLRNAYFQELIQDLLSSQKMKNRGYINTNRAKEIYQNHLNKKTDASKEIWKMINLELWSRTFIDN